MQETGNIQMLNGVLSLKEDTKLVSLSAVCGLESCDVRVESEICHIISTEQKTKFIIIFIINPLPVIYHYTFKK